MGERNTELLLREWGVWLRQGDRVDLSARGSLYNLIPEKRSSFLPANISDSDALDVDRAIAQLRKKRPLLARVLWLEFACGYSSRKLAGLMGCSREAASNMSARAIGMIDCALNPSVFSQDDLEELATLLEAA
jgi:hypothetical protein